MGQLAVLQTMNYVCTGCSHTHGDGKSVWRSQKIKVEQDEKAADWSYNMYMYVP